VTGAIQPQYDVPFRLRGVLRTLSTFIPGRRVCATAGSGHLLAQNESPDPPLPGVVEAIAAAVPQMNRYPDFDGGKLRRRIAIEHDIDEDRVLAGAGSLALLQLLMQAVARPEAQVVHAWRSFELYPVLAELAGVIPVRVPLVVGRHDLAAMAAAVTRRTGMIIVCNPNNPTGTTVGRCAFSAFLDAVPPDLLVVLDEAYCHYVRTPDWPDGVALTARHPNLVVLRTFSKAYGLAGLRVGYLVADPEVVGLLSRARLAFSLNTVAQVAARASLDLRHELLARVESTVTERRRVEGALRAAGWRLPRSEANFVWLPLGTESTAFTAWCARADISVRCFPNEGVRVSIGDPHDNQAFLDAADSWRTVTRC
jgi:histidinol-phosphate aminotransferase